MMNDLVTIIIPVYNVEEFLQDCLLSLDNQTYKNLEIVFVNDGSKDKSRQILEDYCSKHPNSKLINQENMGLSEARNTGIKEINGKYLYFLDPDDIIHPQTIEKFLQILIKTDADLVWSPTANIRESTKYSNIKFKKFSDTYEQWDGQDNICSVFLGKRSGVTNKLFKVEILKQIPGFPIVANKNMVLGEDAYFMSKYLLQSNRMVLTKTKTYLYRIRKSSLVHKPFYKQMLSTMDCLQPLDNIDKDVYKDTINNVRGLKSIFAFFLLFKMNNSDFDDAEYVKNLYKTFKENLKYVRKSKHLFWYIRYLFVFSKPYAFILEKKILKKIKKNKKPS